MLLPQGLEFCFSYFAVLNTVHQYRDRFMMLATQRAGNIIGCDSIGICRTFKYLEKRSSLAQGNFTSLRKFLVSVTRLHDLD